MQPQARRAFALTALGALLSPPAVGLALAVHLLSDHHHEGASLDNAGVEIALHGHAHIEGTPPHGHPIVGSVAAPLPDRILVPPARVVGDAPEVVLGDPLGRRGRGATARPTTRLHAEAPSILRI